MIEKICNLIEERKNDLFGLLSNLIQIDSQSFGEYGKEEECAKYIYQLCKKLDLECDIYSPLDIENFKEHEDYFPERNLENRFNVVAKWLGEVDEDKLMLMAHTDTVKIGDLDNWDFDPFSGEIKDGKIYGRGACDDKYAIASALFIIKLLKELGFKPKSNLLFAAYSDEEYGGSHGAMAAVMKYPCKSILSMDGRDKQIWHCGSGGQEVKYKFHTVDIADSARRAADALPVILKVTDEFAARRKAELEANRFYSGTIIPNTSLRYMGIRAGYDGNDLGRGEVYFVFYTDKTKQDIYAEFAEMEKEIAKQLLPLGIIGDGFVQNTRFFHYVHCEPDSEDVITILEAAKEATGEELLVCGSCLSDLSVISKYGSSNAYGYGCGRDFSTEGGAHQPNEFIECDRLVAYTKNVAAYVIKMLGA